MDEQRPTRQSESVVSPGGPLGWLLTLSPVALVVALMAITPGFHLAATLLIERRRWRWADEYPAVLIGDPALALAAAFGLALDPAAARGSLLADPVTQALAIGAALGFGWWQAAHELRQGRYVRAQIFAPSKLWHQFIVYPVLGWTTTTATLPPVLQTSLAEPRHLVVAAVIIGLITIWGILAVDALLVWRLGHGGFDWRHLRPIHIHAGECRTLHSKTHRQKGCHPRRAARS